MPANACGLGMYLVQDHFKERCFSLSLVSVQLETCMLVELCLFQFMVQKHRYEATKYLKFS